MAGIDFIHQNNTQYEIVPEIAPLFKTTEAYAIGDHVIYEAEWYTFKEAKTAGAWDATKVNGPFKVSEQLTNLKEEFTALESDGVVPSAEQIISGRGVTDSMPYHYRKTGGDGADRLYDQIVGGSVAWNQRAHDFIARTETLGITITVDNTKGSITASGTATATNNLYFMANLRCIQDHKYLFKGSKGNGWLGVSSTSAKDTGNGAIFNAIAAVAGDNQFIYGFSEGDVINETLYPQIFDLTAMFGSTIADYIYQLEQTTAGAGVAFFKALFPNDYYPYNAGELVSVSGLSAHKMVGFNQWDEEWEVGGIKTADGTLIDSNVIIRSKNFNPIIGGASYYLKSTTGSAGTIYIFFYDENKDYIGYDNKNNSVATAPSNAKFFKIQPSSAYGGIYNHDICINISSSRNGEYEPYEEHSYPLDDSLELRGLPKLDADNNLVYDGDVYESTGNVTRKYGIVDLGTLNYNYYAPLTFFYTNITGRASNTNCVCALYTNVGSTGDSAMATVPDMSMAPMASANGQIKFKNSAYTTTGAFKAAMSGVMLVYELAEPTTEEAEPYQHLQQCDPSGTEEYVSTGIVPIGHNSFYPENLRAKVEQLPWNFANLIAPTEATFTATRNYTTGSLFIVDNVLYKATANIANGGTITPNTNCTATTLAEIISALA